MCWRSSSRKCLHQALDQGVLFAVQDRPRIDQHAVFLDPREHGGASRAGAASQSHRASETSNALPPAEWASSGWAASPLPICEKPPIVSNFCVRRPFPHAACRFAPLVLQVPLGSGAACATWELRARQAAGQETTSASPPGRPRSTSNANNTRERILAHGLDPLRAARMIRPGSLRSICRRWHVIRSALRPRKTDNVGSRSNPNCETSRAARRRPSSMRARCEHGRWRRRSSSEPSDVKPEIL